MYVCVCVCEEDYMSLRWYYLLLFFSSSEHQGNYANKRIIRASKKLIWVKVFFLFFIFWFMLFLCIFFSSNSWPMFKLSMQSWKLSKRSWYTSVLFMLWRLWWFTMWNSNWYVYRERKRTYMFSRSSCICSFSFLLLI